MRSPAPTGSPGAAYHLGLRHELVPSVPTITLRHDSRLHHIGIGRGHAGVRVVVLVADLEIRVLTEEGELLRELFLDPSRDYQPQS